MSTGRTITKNALWMTTYPVILGIASLFVSGYVSRVLGKADYGKLVFSFSFIQTFTILGVFGIRAVFVREVVADAEHMANIVGKTLVLRLIMIAIVFVIAMTTLHLMNYPKITEILVYIAAISMFLLTIQTTAQDAFQAMERMHYIALVNMLAGAVLICLSLLAIAIGCSVIGVAIAYVLGSLASTSAAVYILLRKFCIPKLEIDFAFWKHMLSRGAHFFCAAALSLTGVHLGIILLSKLAGDDSDSAVGLFGAADNLTRRLLVIADGISTAVFPAMVIKYRSSPEEAATLFRKALFFLVFLSFPITVGLIIMAKPVLLLINGEEYVPAIPALQIGALWMAARFPCSLMRYTLGAIKREKELARIFMLVLPISLIISALLIPTMKEKGMMIGLLCGEALAFVILAYYTRKYLQHRIFLEWGPMSKIIASTAIMGIVVNLLKHHHLAIPISTGVVIYAVCTLTFKTVDIEDLKTFFKKAKS